MTASLPRFEPMLRTLIETNSISCTAPEIDHSNRGVVETLAGWLDDVGFAVELLPVPGLDDKWNLVATLGRGPGGLVLAGHTDTVPCDPALWRSDPLSLSERDGRFYGLGTADMKGFFPLALEAAREALDQDLAQPLIILATADEECSMDGARALAESGSPAARFAVVGEPTGLKPMRMHKGYMMADIRIVGASGHSSDPGLGHNALETMHGVLGELMAFRTELAREYRHPAFEVDFPTLNLGCLHAGDNPNRICGHADLQIDLRILPGMDNQEIFERLSQRLQALPRPEAVQLSVEPLSPPVPPFETPADSPLVQTVEALCGVEAGAVAFGTEAPFYQQLGMDAVVLGPGHIDQAHQPDEYLELSQIEPTVTLLRQLIRRFCF